MTESLSPQEARKLVLHAQCLPPKRQKESAVSATLAALEHLGYVQIDTLSVVQRAHHHTLWNRNPRYQPTHLDHLLANHQAFEYWSHAAAYLPMRDYRFSLPRKLAIANEEQHHWYQRDKKLMNEVIKRIEREGPLMTRDFTGKAVGEWRTKPAKQALETLFMQGELMVPRRQQFHKVYDLTERVLPDHIDTTLPSPEEHARHLITRYLKANGLGRSTEITYLLKETKAQVNASLKAMASDGELISVKTCGQQYYALPSSLELLNQTLSRSKLSILSPFDNLLIQRKRMKSLFDFDYQMECYLPAAKRQYGYFALPILWDGQLVARMDCKVDRKAQQLHILHLALEPRLSRHEAFAAALASELHTFLKFNGCSSIQLHRCTPDAIHPMLQTAMDSWTTPNRKA